MLNTDYFSHYYYIHMIWKLATRKIANEVLDIFSYINKKEKKVPMALIDVESKLP